MTAEQILAARPSVLFPGTPAQVKQRFKQLATSWHPDHCTLPQAATVFQHLVKCRDAALRGEEGLQRVVFTRSSPVPGKGGQFALSYIGARKTECGQLYVSYDNVSYLVVPEQAGLAEQAVAMRWSFADAKMQDEMTKYLPRHNRTEATTQGQLLVYRRNSDQILLADLLAWHKTSGTALDHRHVMWMVSSLLNTLCYLEIQKTAHCALLPHYLLVSPDMHSVALCGPPMYATPFGKRPKAVPQEVLDAYPRLRTKSTVVENSRLDLTMLRRLALQALGVANVALLARNTALPEGMRKWLASPAPASAVEDYIEWEKARGKRSFTPYGTTASEMYVALAA